MRIGLIAHHTAPIAPPFAGGLEAMTWYLAKWLARRGHDVVLFGAPGSAVPGVRTIDLDLHPPVGELARRDVSMPPGRFLDAHYAYQRLMTDLVAGRHRFDVIHSHALHYLPVALAEMLPTPMVLTLHSPPTPWLEAALAASRRPPRLVAVSRATAEMWRGCDEVIPNGIDLEVWPGGPGGDDLAWTGRIVPEKAPHLALDAARQAGLRLRLAGPRLDAQYFEQEITPRLGSGARYVGHLGHEDLGTLLASSSALLQTPVWDEPFGLTAAEAMATGTPVVSFARGGIPEVVGRHGGLLVEPGDVAAMAGAAREAGGLSRASVRAHARATFGIDRTGCAHETLYARLVGIGSLRDTPDVDGHWVAVGA
jgi:glycosyltransferase involved in cell wall biosynthesis